MSSAASGQDEAEREELFLRVSSELGAEYVRQVLGEARAVAMGPGDDGGPSQVRADGGGASQQTKNVSIL